MISSIGYRRLLVPYNSREMSKLSLFFLSLGIIGSTIHETSRQRLSQMKNLSLYGHTFSKEHQGSSYRGLQNLQMALVPSSWLGSLAINMDHFYVG